MEKNGKLYFDNQKFNYLNLIVNGVENLPVEKQVQFYEQLALLIESNLSIQEVLEKAQDIIATL